MKNQKDVTPFEIREKEIARQAANIIQHHTIGLIKISKFGMNSNNYIHIGAGTLVASNGKKYIITAKHCIDELDNENKVGVVMGNNASKFYLDYFKSRVFTFKDANCISNTDIALIMLHPIEVSSIHVDQAFINFNNTIKEISQHSNYGHNDGWAICGTPGENGFDNTKDPIYGTVKNLENYCLFIDPPDYKDLGIGYDRWFCKIDYSKNEQLPLSFGGMSGGGLWKIIPNDNGQFSYYLVGINYLQSNLENDIRTITCHGFQTIQKLINSFEASLPK